MNFDESEYRRWVETAHEGLRVARHDMDGAFHHAAVLYAEQAAQCALKALLHAVGRGDLARGHGLVGLAEACGEHAGLELDEQVRARLAELARSYQTTRYPDALPEGTPREHYGDESARRAIQTADDVVARVETLWSALSGDDA